MVQIKSSLANRVVGASEARCFGLPLRSSRCRGVNKYADTSQHSRGNYLVTSMPFITRVPFVPAAHSVIYISFLTVALSALV